MAALIVVIFLLSLSSVWAQLRSEETDNVRIVYYDPSHRYVLAHLERCFENALAFHEKFFDYTPSEKVTILLQDFGDYGHGGADSVPTNHISVGLAPFNYVYETMPANERMNWLMIHELVHIVMCDKPSSEDRFFRKIFGGKVIAAPEDPVSMIYTYLTNPRRYSPRWYHEGMAVFMETWMAGGLGRALGGYDEMVFRTMVHDDSYIYQVVGLESEGTAIDFQVGVNSYLYGTRFMTYLAYQYGPDKLVQWVSRTEGSDRYFASQFRKVYGKPLAKAWNDWIDWEHQWQKSNLELIRQYPTTQVRPVCPEPVGSVSRSYYDPAQKVMYAAVRYPGQMAHLAAIDLQSGKMRKLIDVKGPALFYVASLALDQDSQTLFYTTDNNYWRDLNAFDLKTGKSRRLIRDIRTGDLAFNRVDRSLWGIRHNSGLSTVVRVTPPYKFYSGLYTFAYGEDVFDIDLSPDGRYLTAAVADVTGRQKLVRFNTDSLRRGDATPEVLYDFEFSSPANFVYSPDGRYLYGTSYYTGVSNIFRYDFQKREMEVLSNSETGFFRPLPLPDGRLVVYKYTARGFLPVMIDHPSPVQDVSAVKYLGQQVVEKYPVVKTWKLGPPSSVNLDGRIKYSGAYSPVRNTRPISIYPITQGYKDYATVGARVDFADYLGLSGLTTTLSYSPTSELPASEKVHFGAEYRYWNWKIRGTYNYADFYDLFGPTKTSRKGYSLGFSHKKNLLFDTPRTLDLDWGVTGYGGLEKLPDYQNIDASFSRFLTGHAGLNYSFLEKSLGAVDDEKGIKAGLNLRTNVVNAKVYPRVYGNFDYGFLLPLNNSPIWLRSSFGKSFGDHSEPFANFYFGGFGNNWIDHLDVSRYREYESFPGVELNQVNGTDYAKGTVEWNLPPLKLRRLGVPYLYCNWSRLSLFSSGLLTNMASDAYRQAYVDVGAQLDFRIVLFSYLNSTFSLGYAVASDQDKHQSNEFMISLKIL